MSVHRIYEIADLVFRAWFIAAHYFTSEPSRQTINNSPVDFHNLCPLGLRIAACIERPNVAFHLAQK